MADTQRSKSDIATLLADNTTQAISPQDVRDFMESLHFSFGSMYFSSSAETTISVANTFYKAAGTTTDVNLHRFSGKTALAVDNRLKYTGTPDVHIHGACSFSVSVASGTNKLVEVGIWHWDDSAASGSILAHSIIETNQTTTAVQSSASHFDLVMSTNDYIELHVSNETDTVNVTVQYGYLFMLGMFI